jgi:23S rRNA (pseudouridine1915-N3)-methyltransferase
LQPYASVQLVDVAQELVSPRATPAQITQAKLLEGERLLRASAGDAFVIALDMGGKQLSSAGFADLVQDIARHGQTRASFLIGGADGLAPNVLQRADFIWSLSKLTFPHEFVPLLVCEQLFRAFKILRGEPYHR